MFGHMSYEQIVLQGDITDAGTLETSTVVLGSQEAFGVVFSIDVSVLAGNALVAKLQGQDENGDFYDLGLETLWADDTPETRYIEIVDGAPNKLRVVFVPPGVLAATVDVRVHSTHEIAGLTT